MMKKEKGSTPMNNPDVTSGLPKEHSKKSSLTKILIVIAVIVILALLALLFLTSTQKSTRDKERKSIAQEIQKVNKIYWDRNNDYGSDIGDTTNSCVGAGPTTLIGAKLIKCPSQRARSGRSDATWDNVYTYTDSSHWLVKTDLERGGTFSCDQDGCR